MQSYYILMNKHDAMSHHEIFIYKNYIKFMRNKELKG